MEQNEHGQTTAVYYHGFASHGVDKKRRVQVPAKWRPPAGTEMMLVQWEHGQAGIYLRVLTPEKMAKLRANLEALADENKDALLRWFGTRSVPITLDAVGRILLPDYMAEAAGIKNEAVFSGRVTSFEIWSPDRYERVKKADEMAAPQALKLIDL
jgi:MraZ protein